VTDSQEQPPALQNVTAVNGFAYGVIGADIHVFSNGLPLYLLANWRPGQPGSPDWMRELPSRMLNARRAVVPFTGRDDELAQLRCWRDSGPRLAVRWLHGPGGQGKTRLAAQLAAESASAGWKVVAAFHGPDADTPEPGSEDMRPANTSGLLMIVDYAERWLLTNLTWLLKNALLHQAGVVTRILMVSRTADSWPAVRGILDTYQTDTSSQYLAGLRQGSSQRESMFTAALNSFAAIYQLTDVEGLVRPGTLDDPEFELTLAVHMAALVTVDASASGQRLPADTAGLTIYLLDRERLHWARLYADGTAVETADGSYRTAPELMNQTVFTAALTGTVASSVGTTLLENLKLPKPGQILKDHAVCYPPTDPGHDTVLEPLYPDRLAEDFLALTMPGHPADYPPQAWALPTATTLLTRRSRRHVPITWAPRAITFLASAAYRWPHIGQGYLYPTLRHDPQLAVDAGSAALTLIADLPDVTQAVLEAIETRLPDGRHVDLDTGVAAVAARLAKHRLAATRDPAARARILDGLATAFSRAGMHQRAVGAAEEAVAIRRQLTHANPFVQELALAESLGNIAVYLSAQGRSEEALAAAEEALEIERRLAGSDSSAPIWQLRSSAHSTAHNTARAFSLDGVGEWWSRLGHQVGVVTSTVEEVAVEVRRRLARPNPIAEIRQLLAMATEAGSQASIARKITNKAGYLAETGRMNEALVAIGEAVEIWRRLAQAGPAAHEAGLALSLNNLAKVLSALGQEPESLAASGEALAIWRRLARADPTVYEPDLALSLTNHSTHLPTAERYEEALAATREAMEIRRRMVRANPAAHEPGLATSLASLAMRLDQVGRHEEALSAAEEAVEIWRRLAQGDPTAHEPGLSNALSVLGMRLQQVGRYEEALAASRQAEQIQRRLADAAPAAHEFLLVGSLLSMASSLENLGRPEQALAVLTEAAEVQRRLSHHAPAVYEPGLVECLIGMSVLLADLGQQDEALAPAGEAVEISRRLAHTAPVAHNSDLASSLNAYGIRLAALGQREEAVAAITEAVELNPESAEFKGTRGEVYQALGRYEDAVADLTRAVELDPEPAGALAERGETYRLMERHQDALVDLTRAVELDPQLAWAAGTRGLVYQALGRYEDAVADLTRAVELDPELPGALAGRGETYRLMGRYEDAVADLTRAVEFDPEPAWPMGELGETYRLMERHQDAIHTWDQLLALQPNNSSVHENKGITLATVGDFDDALAEFDIASRLAPMEGGEGRTWAAAILWHRRDATRAQNRFALVMDRVTGCTPFRTAEMEGIALCGLGQPDRAKQHLLDAVHLRIPRDDAEPRTIYDLLSDPPLPGIDRLRMIVNET
jgi:tetratricopeptide (TPR) repeat protein